MTRKRVLLTTPMLDPLGLDMLRGEVDVVEGWRLGPDEQTVALATVQGLGGGGSSSDIALGARLEVIASYGSGCDHIDIAAATQAGIMVVSAAGSQYSAVAEHGVGLMLAFAKRIAYADRVMHSERRFVGRGAFNGTGWPGWPTQLRGKTLGVDRLRIHREGPGREVPRGLRHGRPGVLAELRPRGSCPPSASRSSKTSTSFWGGPTM